MPEIDVIDRIASPSSHQGDSNSEHIAQAVEALLTPTIAVSVEKAANAGMRQINKKLGEQPQLQPG